MRGLPQIDIAELGLVLAIALRLLRLAPQRAHPLVELGDDVRDAHQVLARLIELLLGSLLLDLELRDARGLFDDRAAILRTRADDLADTALLDDRVRLGPDAGAEEEVGHVAETARSLVDVVLRQAIAIEPTRDRDLGVARELHRGLVVEDLGDLVLRRLDRIAFGIDPRARGFFELLVGLGHECIELLLGIELVAGLGLLEGLVREPDVVERQRDLGHRRGTTGLRAGEDHVFHRLAAEVLRALLAHRPTQGVDDVGLAAPVWTDNAGHRRIDIDNGAVAERLEADDLDSFDTQRLTPG